MNGGNHPRGGEPSFPQLLEGLQKGLEIFFVCRAGSRSASYRRRRSPLAEKTTGASCRHSGDTTTGAATLCSKTRGWRGCTVAPAPASTGGCSHQPAPPCEPFFPPSARQKAPQRRDGSTGPSGGNPQISLTNRREDGCLRDGVGAEIVQLHPVDVQYRPHKTACRHSEPPLVKRDEAHHIPRRWGRGGSARRGIHSGCESPERGRSKPSATRASRSSAVTVEKGHGSRGEITVTRSAITKQKRWRRKGRGARFPFSGYSLGLRKPKWEASSRVENRHRTLSRIYKGPGKTRSTLRPNPPRGSKLKARRPFLERLAHAQQLPREPLVPSH
jgi:hypothetical protein